MGVSADNHLETGGRRVQIELVKVVEDVKGDSAQFHGFGRGKIAAPGAAVHVSAHGDDDRRDALELVQYLFPADITGMEDHLDVGQSPGYLGAQDAVGVGDDTDRQGVGLDVFSHALHVDFRIRSWSGNARSIGGAALKVKLTGSVEFVFGQAAVKAGIGQGNFHCRFEPQVSNVFPVAEIDPGGASLAAFF